MASTDLDAPSPHPPSIDAPFLNKADVAAFFGVSTRTVDRLMASGHLGYTKVSGQVRFSLLDVAMFLAKHGVNAIA
jgi:excisionase family DNA binding protein